MNTIDKKTLLEETGCLSSDLMLRYRDNKLSAEERHSVERHLVDCPLCTEALEGVMLVSSPVVFDQLNDSIKSLTSKGASVVTPKQYWLAAASVSAIVILSAYLYSEYKSVQHPAVVLQHEPVKLPQSDNGVSLSAPANESVLTESPQAAKIASKNATGVSEESLSKVSETSLETAAAGVEMEHRATETADATVAESNNEAATDSEVLKDFSYSQQVTNQSTYPRMEKPIIIGDLDKANDEKVQSSKAPQTTSGSATPAATGGTTYLLNLKVIEYVAENYRPQQQDGPAKSVESKYQNRQKKETDAAQASTETRKVSYLDLLETPIAHYKNKNYQQAISGFNEILVLNPEDQNAQFYKGLSFYNLQRYNDAIASLSGPGNDLSSTFYEEARFYMGKSYAALGNVEIAKDIFTAISTAGGFYANQAKSELEKLR